MPTVPLSRIAHGRSGDKGNHANVAIVAYKVHEDLIVEGKPVSLDATDSSTWVKRGGQWRCALHTDCARPKKPEG